MATDCCSTTASCKEPSASDCFDRQHVLIETRRFNQKLSPCDPDCGDTTCEAPKQEPEFDEITDIATIPVVGGFFRVNVPNPSVYTVDQWVYLAGYGRFRIEDQDPCSPCPSLTLHNSCEEAAVVAIVGNATPGTTIPAGTKFWVVDQPACVLEDEESSVDKFKNDASLVDTVCWTNMDEWDGSEKMHLFGGTDDDNLSCQKKLIPVYARRKTICTPEMPQVDGNKVSGISKRFVVTDPLDNESCHVALPPQDEGVYKYCDGHIKFIPGAKLFTPADLQEIGLFGVYSFINNIPGGSTEERQITVTVPNVPVSDCDRYALIGFTILISAIQSTNALIARLHLGSTASGPAVVHAASAEQFNTPENLFNPGLGNVWMPIKLDSNGRFQCVLAVDGGPTILNTGVVNGTYSLTVNLAGYYI